MHGIITLLPFLKILSTFILILVCIRLKLGLWLSVLGGALSIALLFGLGAGEWLQVSVAALGKEKFLFLVSIVGLILILSDGLERSGQSQRLMDALSGYLHDNRLRLIFFPALIGLLPMPGGAVFSAPMVKAVSADMPIQNIDRAIINYWFRHVWELAWPLYPGIILTVALAEIPSQLLSPKAGQAWLPCFCSAGFSSSAQLLGVNIFPKTQSMSPKSATSSGYSKRRHHCSLP